MESRRNVGNHTHGSAVYRTNTSSLYHAEAFKPDLNLTPSSTSELNTFDHSFPNSPAALYQMTEPSIQLFLPYHTAPRSTYYSPAALPDPVLSPSTLPVNSSDSTQDFIGAPSSSRSGVRTFHDQQLLETGYYATYPESSSWITSAPRQDCEASTASSYNGGSVAGGAMALDPSNISDASFALWSHHGATPWYNPQQLSGEWTCGNSIDSAPLTHAPTWTEMQEIPSSSVDHSASASGAQWKTNQTTDWSFEHASAPTNVDRNAHHSIHLGFSFSNFDVDFGLNPEEGDHLAPGSFASPGKITSVQSSSPASPAPTASSSSATRQSSQPYTRSTKETRLPSCSERRTKLVFCCEWDGCEEACNGLRAFKEHLKKVHKLPVGNSSTKNTKTCLWKGCGEPHIPDRGARSVLPGTRLGTTTPSSETTS